MKKSLIYFALFIFVSCMTEIYAQSENITIQADSRVNELIDRHIRLNQVANKIPGFRIQLFISSGNFSRQNAITEKTKFETNFPNDPSYLIFNTPNYILRVGNFRTRLEAEAYRQKILSIYPEAYIVRDEIEIPQ